MCGIGGVVVLVVVVGSVVVVVVVVVVGVVVVVVVVVGAVVIVVVALGGAIFCLVCAETRVLALCSPGMEFAFLYRFMRCFEQKNKRQPASYTVQKNAVLSISHRFLRCFCRLSTFARASFDLLFYFSFVRGWGVMGGEGLMTSMRMRILCCVFVVDLVLVCSGLNFRAALCRPSTCRTCQLGLPCVCI